MRVAIIGAGALGSAIGGLLSAADSGSSEVWLIGAQSSTTHLGTIQSEGLHLHLSQHLAMSLLPTRHLRVSQTPANAYPCDLAIVAVKSYRTIEAAGQVAALSAPDGLALTLQNGLGNLEILQQALTQRVIQGTTLLAANTAQAGHVNIAALGTTTLALDPELTAHQRHILEWFKDNLEAAGASFSFTENLQGTIWAKLIINCAVNPICALLDIPNGALLAHDETRQIMSEVVAEVIHVSQSQGIVLPYADEQAMQRVINAIEVTATNFCSMLQDVRRHRPTEIDALNGAVVAHAERLGIAVPVNRTLTNLIRVRQNLIA